MVTKGKFKAITALILAAALAGCTSVKSTYLHRDEEDTGWDKNHIKGIPITLEVPTHVRFSIFETIYTVNQGVTTPPKFATPEAEQEARQKFRDATAAAENAKAAYNAALTIANGAVKKAAETPSNATLRADAEAAAITAAEKKVLSDRATEDLNEALARISSQSSNQLQLVMLDNARPLKTYNVTYDLITEKKIFGVDFKRPAAGPFSLTANLKNQYFTDVDHRLTDQTIEKVGSAINTLIGQIVPTGVVPAGKAQSATGAGNAVPTPLESLVCSEVFRIDSPDYEVQIAAFLRKHCCAAQPIQAAPYLSESVTGSPNDLPPPLPETPAPFPGQASRDVNAGVVRTSATKVPVKPTITPKALTPPQADRLKFSPPPAGR